MADSAYPRIKHRIAKVKNIVASKGPPYRSRRRLAADNDGALSVLTVPISAESDSLQVATTRKPGSSPGFFVVANVEHTSWRR